MPVFGTLLLALAFGCIVAYKVIGSHVDESGWLHEPSALIPLAWLAGLTGVALLAFSIWRRFRARS